MSSVCSVLRLISLVCLSQVFIGWGDRLGHSASQSGLWADAPLHADCAGTRRRRGGNDWTDPCQRGGCQWQCAAVPEGGVRGLAERERASCPAGGTSQGVCKTCTNKVKTLIFYSNITVLRIVLCLGFVLVVQHNQKLNIPFVNADCQRWIHIHIYTDNKEKK